MASTASIFPAQALTGDPNHLNDGVAEGKNHQALGEIGDLVIVTCQEILGTTKNPKEQFMNIDAADLAGVEYVEDIYNFYKQIESHSQVFDYIDSQPEIDEIVRALLVDYLIKVHHSFKLEPEALYLAINIVDRFLSVQIVRLEELQLVGMTAMFMASKYEKNPCACPLQMKDLISAESYTHKQILMMERDILLKLRWNLAFPTPYVFLIRFIKASICDVQMEHAANFFAELGVTFYVTMMYGPSMLAAAAVYAARCTLRMIPTWDVMLEHCTGYSEKQLLDCAKALIFYHEAAAEGELKLYEKYSQPKRSQVVLLPPAIWCL